MAENDVTQDDDQVETPDLDSTSGADSKDPKETEAGAVTKPDDDSGESGADGEAGDGDATDKQNTAAFIRKLKREKREALKAADASEQRARAAEQKVSAGEEPDPDDYADKREYAKAYAKWDDGQSADTSPGMTTDSPYAARLVKAGFDQADAVYLSDSFAEAKERHEDFDTVVTTNQNLTPEMVRAMVDADDPGELLHYVATTPTALKELASAGNVAIAIGRVEERMKQDALRGNRRPGASSDDEIDEGTTGTTRGDSSDRVNARSNSEDTFAYLEKNGLRVSH